MKPFIPPTRQSFETPTAYLTRFGRDFTKYAARVNSFCHIEAITSTRAPQPYAPGLDAWGRGESLL